MSKSCSANSTAAPANWYQIANALLNTAGIEIGGLKPWDIVVHNPKFYQRVLQTGSLGLGESYMAGWWDCLKLDQFFYRLLVSKVPHQLPANWRDTLRIILARLSNRQNPARAFQVGKTHYDLGNTLFSKMLDPYMQYSCGYWDSAKSLETAQVAKLDLLCRKLQLKPRMTLLDIGCGWGGLAEYAAKTYGAKVYGITISRAQQELAIARCHGLDVTIVLQDYRSLAGQFDRIVSVGMFEHVGPKNYATYFKKVAGNLKPDGIFVLHTIGSNKTDSQVDAWTEQYIFPNGCLPSMRHIADVSERYFILEDWHNFGADYDRTLMAWYQRFIAHWPQLSAHYDERFKRMFSYYLNSCAGAFRARELQLWQLVFTRGLSGGLRVAR